MDWNQLLFNFTSFAPGPIWLAFWLAPQQSFIQRVTDILIIILCCVYAGVLMPSIIELIPIIANPSLENITQMLSTQIAVVGAWTHFVIGDLWVGRWIALDSQRCRFKQWARLPMLLLTLFFGPIGFICYLSLRWLKTKENPFRFSQDRL